MVLVSGSNLPRNSTTAALSHPFLQNVAFRASQERPLCTQMMWHVPQQQLLGSATTALVLPLPSRGSPRTLQPVAAFSGGKGSRLQSALLAPLAPRVQSVSCAVWQDGRRAAGTESIPWLLSCNAGGADRQEICRAFVHGKAIPPAGSRALEATSSQLCGGEHLRARPSPHKTLLHDLLVPPLKELCPTQQ